MGRGVSLSLLSTRKVLLNLLPNNSHKKIIKEQVSFIKLINLSAVQGKTEQRSEACLKVCRASSTGFNAEMRQMGKFSSCKNHDQHQDKYDWSRIHRAQTITGLTPKNLIRNLRKSMKSNLEDSFALICFQRLSKLNVASRLVPLAG